MKRLIALIITTTCLSSAQAQNSRASHGLAVRSLDDQAGEAPIQRAAGDQQDYRTAQALGTCEPSQVQANIAQLVKSFRANPKSAANTTWYNYIVSKRNSAQAQKNHEADVQFWNSILSSVR